MMTINGLTMSDRLHIKIQLIPKKIKLWSIENIYYPLKKNIRIRLGIKFLAKEVHANFIQINALENYIKKDKEIEEFVINQCKKHNITDSGAIKQIIKNQEAKNYLNYNNKILPEEMKEVPKKVEGNDLYIIKND